MKILCILFAVLGVATAQQIFPIPIAGLQPGAGSQLTNLLNPQTWLQTFLPFLNNPNLRTVPGLPSSGNNLFATLFPWLNGNGNPLQSFQIPIQGLQNVFRPPGQQQQQQQPSLASLNNPGNAATPSTPSVSGSTASPSNNIPALGQFPGFQIPLANPGIPNLPGSNLITGIFNERDGESVAEEPKK